MDISRENFLDNLTRVFTVNGMGELLTPEKCDKFYRLTEIMLDENEKYNLTAITAPDKIILNHYADCATMARALKTGATVIDVGCGAGFPTLPLAIVRPDLKILAVDSTAKRVRYVEMAASELGLSCVKCAVMRAEEGGRMAEYREKFDYATARAVAGMRVLCELCLPFVKLGGEMVAMKGRSAEEELTEAKAGILLLGGGEARIEEIVLTGGEEELRHPLISIKKKKHTPERFPRQYSQISKKPL